MSNEFEKKNEDASYEDDVVSTLFAKAWQMWEDKMTHRALSSSSLDVYLCLNTDGTFYWHPTELGGIPEDEYFDRRPHHLSLFNVSISYQDIDFLVSVAARLYRDEHAPDADDIGDMFGSLDEETRAKHIGYAGEITMMDLEAAERDQMLHDLIEEWVSGGNYQGGSA